jgi:hypothetical protein
MIDKLKNRKKIRGIIVKIFQRSYCINRTISELKIIPITFKCMSKTQCIRLTLSVCYPLGSNSTKT